MRFSASLLALVAPTVLAAQSAYLPTRDTLRFREVTRFDITMIMPQGNIPMGNTHDGTIAIVGMPGDSVRAWYEALAFENTAPGRSLKLDTDSALRRPFHLKIDARGRVTVLRAPAFPESFEGVTDLTRQFDDYFLRLPAQTLRLGLAWADTVTRSDSSSERFSRTDEINTYRVERDTVVKGLPAFVISMKQQTRTRSEGPMRGQPVRIGQDTQGTDDGFVVFSARAGRMLGRSRRATFSGTLTIRGPNGSNTIQQNIGYTSTITPVP